MVKASPRKKLVKNDLKYRIIEHKEKSNMFSFNFLDNMDY